MTTEAVPAGLMVSDYESPTLAKLAAALAKAQGEFPPIVKDRTAIVKSDKGGGYSYHYADLASITAATAPILSRHGLALMQRTKWDAASKGGLCLETRLLHESGEWTAATYPLPSTAARPQDMGIAITYARRYSATAMLGIATEEDTDGGVGEDSVDRVTASAIADHLSAIEAAVDEDDLKRVYLVAYRAAGKDKAAATKFEAAKDARKAQITKATKAAAK